MKTNRRVLKIGRIVITGLLVSGALVWACSSGGGSDNGSTPPPGGGNPPPSGGNPPPVQTPSGTVIKGTVPGTIIHTFGDDGSYYKTETNPSDTPPRPFALSVKPGIGYRLVLEENGTFYPMFFDSGKGATTNRFYMSLVKSTLDLGQVTMSGGLATPQVNPLSQVDSDGDGVADLDDADYVVATDDVLDADGDGIPNALDTDYVAAPGDTDGDGIPDAQDADIDNDGIQNADDLDADGDGADSSDDLLTRATAQLLAGNVLGAYQSFQEIVTREPNHQLGNIGLAVTRIGAVLTDLSPGTDPNKLETVKEFLDRAGFSQEGRHLTAFSAHPPRVIREDIASNAFVCYNLPENAPSTNDIIAYLNERVVPQVKAALDNLDVVTADFSYTPATPIEVGDVRVASEIDYSDVLTLKAALRGLLTLMTLANVYDFNFDVDALVNQASCDRYFADPALSGLPVSPTPYQGVRPEAFFAQYPNLGKIKNLPALTDLEALANATISGAIAALDAIHLEKDDQIDDLVTTDPGTYTADRAFLLQIQAALSGPVSFLSLNGSGPAVKVNAAPFFDGINLRAYMPALVGGRVVYSSIRASSYDPTFGGILPDVTADDIVRVLDQESPRVAITGVSGGGTSSLSFQIEASDFESLPNKTLQIGSGVDPASLQVVMTCSATGGCTMTGIDGNGTAVTSSSSFADITPFLNMFGPDGERKITWTPNGGTITINQTTPGEIGTSQLSVMVRDAAGNSWFISQLLKATGGSISFNLDGVPSDHSTGGTADYIVSANYTAVSASDAVGNRLVVFVGGPPGGPYSCEGMYYYDNAGSAWGADSSIGGTCASAVTSYGGVEQLVVGSFSGTLEPWFGNATANKAITNGDFSVLRAPNLP